MATKHIYMGKKRRVKLDTISTSKSLAVCEAAYEKVYQ